MTINTPDIASWSDQINRLIAENRRLINKSEADDHTIGVLKQQYDGLQAGVEAMVEDHRRIERGLMAERDRAVRAFAQIDGLLNCVGDLVVQAARARSGDATPEKMPAAKLAIVADGRLPQVSP